MTVFKARLIPIVAFVVLLCALIVSRLFVIQVLHQRKYADASRRQTEQRAVLKGRRGSIRDRAGHVLATSIPSQIDMTKDVLLAVAESKEQSERLAEQESAPSKRVYPFGERAGEVLGYVGRDGFGLGGVEYAFDKVLRGEDGWTIMQRDGRNRRYERIDMPRRAPTDGSDVYLTLDIDIQKIVERVLAQTVEDLGAKGGMCVVMDPMTGEIRAMANYPGFNPNLPGRFTLAQRTNSCIAYNYEPGSTFKSITAAVALQDRLFSENDTIDGNQGVYEIYDQSIRDHKPYGKLSFAEVMTYSSNVCIAKIADKLGRRRLYESAKDFGIGAGTGIDLPGEEKGIVHPIDDWSGRTLVTMAIGQEVSTTLLQMMMVYSAIANGGLLLQPRICDRVVSPEGKVQSPDGPKVVRRVVSKSTAARLVKILESVVDSGTGRKAGIPNVAIGGKTGTSQKYDKETGTYSSEHVLASFIGFAPVTDPVLLCGVVIDEPKEDAAGGLAAAPAFREILSRVISHPRLDYAELILQQPEECNVAAERCPPIPDVCGMRRSEAEKFLRDQGLRFDIVGSGPRIGHQSPAAGNVAREESRLVLYAVEGNETDDATGRIRVPNCVGKDLRDAINVVNVKGLVPYVAGAGTVYRQMPTVGTMVQTTAVCTLYCSYEG